MLEFFKKSFKVQLSLVFLAVIAGIYRTEIVLLLKNIVGQYLPTTTSAAHEGESVAVEFTQSDQLFTPAQLAKFNGENGAPIYLALLGAVFDVTRGVKHYGPGCSYNYFVGRDASVSFISGEFDHYDPTTADDVLSLKPEDLLGLDNWKQFYVKDYVYKGKVIGRFYDEHGAKTSYHHKYLALLDQAQIAKAQVEQLRTKYPDCNIEWSEEKGTRVWCTPTSGGGQARDWTGYPRKLYSRGNKKYHCACVPEDELRDLDAATTKAAHGDAMFKPYNNCEPRAHECFYRV
ncbi:neuferricin homolog [Scaptodrosophila lebanonensis]|uniref:Neuferricin homolog n=1 Tax=Drosophila lebanonensis TaxID=7225 RepID=A0A6J2UH62_DROLE|nr:neuferricin homolog [Scaptodrosophila lebanonensis]